MNAAAVSASASREITRRTGLLSLSVAALMLLKPELSRAGGQIEEPLADAVRTALSAAISDQGPPVPVFADTGARLVYINWLIAMSWRLRDKQPDRQVREDFLQTLWYESHRAGLDEALVLGLIQVESNFRKYAISSAGALGYMQVMPFWVRLIGDGNVAALFRMQTNLRFGCVILRHYLNQEQGNLFMALGRYNGSRGLAAYPDAVLAAAKRWNYSDAPVRVALP
ncbi:MAG: lytic transglycosylase domain-containing protein [Burkholderiales bacterium]|nr:lytic transglycosylase domain-containing protein [Burkholderiales bacterium]